MPVELKDIEKKVNDGIRLSEEDGQTLFATKDLWTLCELAHSVKTRLHGDKVYYNINRHFNYSNVCALSCKFCDFYRKKGEDGAYEFSIDDVRQQARNAKEAGATEIHVVGGLHPWLPFDYYTDMMQAIHDEYPEIHIKGYTAVEIVHLARISRRAKDIRGVLQDLMDAGLGSLPGGGAEVFDDRIHDEAFKGKIRSEQWLEVHRVAHELGLMSNATMLYGHIESIDDRLHHFMKLRETQDIAIAEEHPGRFQTIIPLPFIPGESELKHLPGPTGVENLKMLAISRLMLDNFPHVKAFWIMQTLELAQMSLTSGVDDIDGTVVWYDITKVKRDTSTHQETTPGVLRELVHKAGFTPVERDTLYREVKRDGPLWEVADDLPQATVSA